MCFSTGRFRAIPLLQLFFVCLSMVSNVDFAFSLSVPLLEFFFVSVSVVTYVTFVLSLCFPHLSFFPCLRKAVLRDCGISSVTLFMFCFKVYDKYDNAL